jgi:hypothetical protein
MKDIPPFQLFEDNRDYNAGEQRQQLKRREMQNIERYKAAQERNDNYAIKYYEFRMKLDDLDAEKSKLRNQIFLLKKKFGKL